MIDTLFIGAMGFTQNTLGEDGKPTGVAILTSRVDEWLTEINAPRSTACWLMRWNADPKDCVDRLRLAMNPARGVDVVLAAYSWGAGNFAAKFSELAAAVPGIRLRYAILSDPVYRSRWPWMRWLAVSALGQATRVRITGAWDGITTLYQRNVRPWGTRVAAEIDRQDVFDLTRKGYSHIDMDNAPEFHLEAMSRFETVVLEGAA